MKYVEFYDTSSGQPKYLGEIRLEGDKLELSDELARHWQGSYSYNILAGGGYEAYYEPEKILYSLPERFKDPEFRASDVKERDG